MCLLVGHVAFSAERGSDGLQTSLQAGGQPSPGVRRGDVGDTERFCGGGPGSVRDGAQEYSAPAAAAGCRGGGYVVVVGRRERRTVGAETGQQPQDPQLVVGRGDQHRRRDTGPRRRDIGPDVETPARPVSPRRISDPICQHSGSQVHSVESPWNSVPLPTAAPPSARVPPRSIVTTAQMHAEPQMSAESGTDPLPLAPAGRSTCLPGELQSDTDSRHHCWRLPSSTPTARREHIAELQQQRAGTSSSLGSLHHQRLASSVSSPVAAGFGPRHGDPDTCRGVVPGHLLYRRPAACRSETASPDIDYDDDDDDGLNLTSSATRDRPWHVRRHLKAISERSQSTDTIYV